MRCPKCGYISFDHLEECLKCKKNIKTASDDLQGSVFNVTPPVFLKFQPEDRSLDASSDEMDVFVDDDSLGEFVDEDLEILIDDEDGDENEIENDIISEDEESAELVEVEVESEDAVAGDFDEVDDSEFELDFGQLEDTSEPEIDQFDEPVEKTVEEEQAAEMVPDLEIPEELADVSDLAPPAADDGDDETEAPAKVVAVAEEPEEPEEDIASLDLDALDFELGLGGLEGDLLGDTGGEKEAVLALDDIDFSEALADISPEPPATPPVKSTNMGMDEELNFDLDLGGLSIKDDI